MGVVIPAYNEERQIDKVLETMPEYAQMVDARALFKREELRAAGFNSRTIGVGVAAASS